ISSALCHLANISYQLGEPDSFDSLGTALGSDQAIGQDAPVQETLERMCEHLKDDNGLKLDGMQYRLGRRLRFDGGAERFVDDAEANALLTRDYRAPFVVPESLS